MAGSLGRTEGPRAWPSGHRAARTGIHPSPSPLMEWRRGPNCPGMNHPPRWRKKWAGEHAHDAATPCFPFASGTYIREVPESSEFGCFIGEFCEMSPKYSGSSLRAIAGPPRRKYTRPRLTAARPWPGRAGAGQASSTGRDGRQAPPPRPSTASAARRSAWARRLRTTEFERCSRIDRRRAPAAMRSWCRRRASS